MGTIDDLRNKITNLAAPNRFQVEMVFPSFVGGGNALQEACTFFCKGASIPPENVGQVEVPFHGMTLKLSGDRDYGDWSVTVYNTETWDIRTAMENWMRYVHDPVTGLKTNHQDYMVDLKVKQLGITSMDAGAPVAAYMFKSAWPKTVSEIALDFESNNQIETFEVTFGYQYHIRAV